MMFTSAQRKNWISFLAEITCRLVCMSSIRMSVSLIDFGLQGSFSAYLYFLAFCSLHQRFRSWQILREADGDFQAHIYDSLASTMTPLPLPAGVSEPKSALHSPLNSPKHLSTYTLALSSQHRKFGRYLNEINTVILPLLVILKFILNVLDFASLECQSDTNFSVETNRIVIFKSRIYSLGLCNGTDR